MRLHPEKNDNLEQLEQESPLSPLLAVAFYLYVLIEETWKIWKELRRYRDDLEAIQEGIQSLQDAPDDASADRLLSREEAADRLRISVRTLDDMAAAGEIQPVRIRGRVLYHPEALDAFIRRSAGGGRR